MYFTGLTPAQHGCKNEDKTWIGSNRALRQRKAAFQAFIYYALKSWKEIEWEKVRVNEDERESVFLWMGDR